MNSSMNLLNWLYINIQKTIIWNKNIGQAKVKMGQNHVDFNIRRHK
jgi:hypothetical protein